MKKIGLLGFLLTISSLSGCGEYKVPTTSFEKVRTAFKGVEKSFKSPKLEGKKQGLLGENALKARNIPNGLEQIARLYGEGDKDNNSLEDITYNQPPMVQFQCLKKAYEKIGAEYKFDTKYFDNIQGTIYFDVTTGKEADKKDENKVNFDFELALDISIDEHDLITADVSFKIDLTKGQDHFNDRWYVRMELDYEMEKANPTYSLSMFTCNNHENLPWSKSDSNCTYEYDYVDMKESQIHEWRKFVLSTSEEIKKDETHQHFSDYTDGGIEYRADTVKWYHDGQGYKFMQSGGTREAQVAGIYFEDIGLNSTDIDGVPFFNKEGERNAVMKELYNEFSKQVKHELVLELVKAGEGRGQGDQNEIAGIAIMRQDLSGYFGGYECPDMSIIDIFNGYQSGSDNVLIKPRAVYVNADDGYVRDVDDVRALEFFFSVSSLQGISENNAVPLGYNNTIKYGYECLQNAAHQEITDPNFIIIVHESDHNFFTSFSMHYKGDFPEFNPDDNPPKK